MIDPLTEKLIGFAEASKLFPPRRRGRRPSISCFYRWTNQGVRGIRLEYLQCGGARFTTAQAVARFLLALTAGGSPPARTAPRNVKAIAKAEKFLDEEGVGPRRERETAKARG